MMREERLAAKKRITLPEMVRLRFDATKRGMAIERIIAIATEPHDDARMRIAAFECLARWGWGHPPETIDVGARRIEPVIIAVHPPALEAIEPAPGVVVLSPGSDAPIMVHRADYRTKTGESESTESPLSDSD